MHNVWVGTGDLSGPDSPLKIKVSPYFFGQHGLINMLYIPKVRDLPSGGFDLKGLVFDFGFNAGQLGQLSNLGLGPFETQDRNYQTERPFLIWGISGVSNDLSVPYVGYNVQIFHSHQGAVRQLFNKAVADGEIVGTGARVHIVRSPYLVLKGDQLQCQVKNLSNNQANPGFPAASSNAKVQVVLWGGEFD
jgi:hypothetical protein